MRSQLRFGLAGSAVAASLVALSVVSGYGASSATGFVHGNVQLADGAVRTWVSGVGDDANPCSRTAPCKTFAGAIIKTQAGGEIDSLDPGGFGAVTITKAITIDGRGGHESSILNFGGNGIVINAGPNDVVILRHLQIQGVGTGSSGIRFIGGKALILDDVDINNFQNNGVDVSLAQDASTVVIKDSRIRNNGGAGISLSTTAGGVRATITGSDLTSNHDGLLAGNGADVDLGNSVAALNTGAGAGCTTSATRPCTLHTTHDQFDHNGSGVAAVHSAGTAKITISLSDDDVFGNSFGLRYPGATASDASVLSFGNNRFLNNQVNGKPTQTLSQS